MDDGRELSLAERTNRSDLGPLQKTREAEFVEARVSHGFIVNISKTIKAL